MPYMVTFTINIPPMLAYIPYMDPMGNGEPSWYSVQTWWTNSRMGYLANETNDS